MNWIKNLFFKSKDSGNFENVEQPSFSSLVTVYQDRLKVAKWLVFCIASVSLLLIVAQETRFSKVAKMLVEKDYLIVPGAPEFMRIRPGFIAPESVYLFAEYTASQLSSFSHNTVDNQYKAVSEFMTPELKTRFLLSTEKPIKMYKELKVDQVFDLEPVKNFDIRNDARGAKYIVKVRGQTRKYVEGSLRESVPTETITFVFRPRKIKQNQPWFFEIESFERLTPDEEEKKRALESIPDINNK